MSDQETKEKTKIPQALWDNPRLFPSADRTSAKGIPKALQDSPLADLSERLIVVDGRLNPGVFVDYCALLIRTYMGVPIRLVFNDKIGRMFATPFGTFSVGMLPDRHTFNTQLHTLSDEFEWMPLMDLGDNSKKIHHCLLLGDKNNFVFIYSIKYANTLLYYACPNTNGGVSESKPLLVRKYQKEKVWGIWKQGEAIYVLVACYAHQMFDCKVFNITLTISSENECIPVIAKVLDVPEAVYFIRLFHSMDGAHYDPSSKTLIFAGMGHMFRVTSSSCTSIRLGDDLMGGQLRIFFFHFPSQRYLIVKKDGVVLEVDFDFNRELVIVKDTLAKLPLWGHKLLMYHPDTDMLVAVSQQMASSKFHYNLFSTPLYMFFMKHEN